jgi:phosphate transport system substrate-binding protein
MRKIFLCILSIGVVFISCKKSTTKDPWWDDTYHSGLIRIACDENFRNLMDAEIEVFEAHNPDAVVVPIYRSEPEVIRLFTDDSVRFVLTTRTLTPKEQADINKLPIRMKVRENLIGFDAIALIMNKANNDSILSMQDLKKILTGEITQWSQLNPATRIGAIRVMVDHRSSGVVRYIVDSITKEAPLSPEIYALNNSEEVIEKVMQMPNTIGIFGANALKNAPAGCWDKIRLIRISKEEPATASNSYLPYAGDIRSENYPLWRPVYVLLSDPKTGLASGLSIFLAHEAGQMILYKSGLLPVTDPHNRSLRIVNEYPE